MESTKHGLKIFGKIVFMLNMYGLDYIGLVIISTLEIVCSIQKFVASLYANTMLFDATT